MALTDPPGCYSIPNTIVSYTLLPGNSLSPTASGTYQVSSIIIRNTICGADTHFAQSTIYIEVIPSLNINVSVSGNELFCPSGDTLTLTAISNGNSIQWFGPGIIGNSTAFSIDIDQSGTYALVVTDTPSVCVNPSTQWINVISKAQPTITRTPSNGLVCPGDSVIMNVNLPGLQ